MSELKTEYKIPEISDEALAERMKRIRFVVQAMSGIDGKPYPTEETNKKLFELFYKESSAHPRNQSFNFDQNSKITEKAVGLKELLIKDVLIKVGGYYGFLKMTMAEVLSQIPEEIVDEVVAFALNPEKDSEVLPGAEYQLASIIFYGKTDEVPVVEELPSYTDLIKPIDMDKVNRLKDIVRPIINYTNEGYFSLDPQDVKKPFMDIGIWLRVNGSNLHRTNTETKITVPCKMGKEISVYQAFTNGADSFEPTYAHTISQIPDELINENTIGFSHRVTDYFKTKEGIIHETKYTLIEKE